MLYCRPDVCSRVRDSVNINTSTAAAAAVAVVGREKPKPRKMTSHSKKSNKKNGEIRQKTKEKTDISATKM